MNEHIKRIVALSLAVGTVSIVTPATNYNILTTKAYASNNDADNLKSVELEDDDGNSLNLYTDDDYNNEVDDDLDSGNTYYTETTASAIKIDSVSGTDDDNVRIFMESNAYEVGDSISLDEGTTTLKVRVYEDDYDEDKSYDSNDYNEYKIKVKHTGDDNENNDDTFDSVELLDESEESIDLYSGSDYSNEVDSNYLDEGNTYYAKTSSYNVSVETTGPSDKYVRIFDSTSDLAKDIDVGDYISISEDKTLTIRIYSEEPNDDIEYEDDDKVIGEYKIKLEYTGTDSSSSTSDTTNEYTDTTTETATSTVETTGSTTQTMDSITETTTSTAVSTAQPNQWIQINGFWQYIDETGNTLKSQWYFDGNYGRWYYLSEDGNMLTNSWKLTGDKYYYLGADGAMVTNFWVSDKSKYYYLGTDGAMVTNFWVPIAKKYYYLGSDGAMLTNSWVLTGSKYYYLGIDGAMVTNTTINGYRIGPNGAWIK